MSDSSTSRSMSGVKPAVSPEKESGSLVAGGTHVRKSVTIDRPRGELYQFWRRLTNLPRIMKHVQSISEISETQSHWVVEAPAGRVVEWDATILRDLPNELISWRSSENADVDNAGSVTFREAPEGRGSIVTTTFTYNPPGGYFGSLAAKLFGEEPSQQAAEDLRRFKALMETGEIPTAESHTITTQEGSSK